MSSTCWLTDPSLFVEYYDCVIRLWRLPAKYTFPMDSGRCIHDCDVHDYLSLVDHSFEWKKSDFYAFADFLYKHDCLVNCQGLVLPVTFPRDRTNNNKPSMRGIRFMSHEVLNLSNYGLPPPSVPFRDVQYLQDRGPAAVEYNSREKELATKLEASNKERDQEKAEKQALEIEVRRLKAMNSTLQSKNYLFNQKAI